MTDPATAFSRPPPLKLAASGQMQRVLVPAIASAVIKL
jgi:hypothetical protein